MNASPRRAELHRLEGRPYAGGPSPRTAFVLSGGAGLGALQVGMLEALYERGMPDFLGCRVEAHVARYSAEAELIMLPAPNAGCVQPTSFEHSQRLIAHAREAARTALQRSPRRAHLRLVS